MKLIIYLGPMFSGKTSHLLLKANKYKYLNIKHIYIKYIKDIRYSNIINHDNYKLNNEIESLILNNLCDHIDILSTYNNIYIDEAQFFNDLVNFYIILRNKKLNINIYISYLNFDFNEKPFSNNNILNYSNKIKILTSICEICKNNKALYTKLRNNNKNKENNILIGGKELYIVKCEKCLLIQ